MHNANTYDRPLLIASLIMFAAIAVYFVWMGQALGGTVAPVLSVAGVLACVAAGSVLVWGRRELLG